MSKELKRVLAANAAILKLIGLKKDVRIKKWKTWPDEKLAVLADQLEYDLARYRWAEKNKTQCIATTTQGTRCTKNGEVGDYTCKLHRDTIPKKSNTIDQGVAKCRHTDKWGRLCAMPMQRGLSSCGFHETIKEGGK